MNHLNRIFQTLSINTDNGLYYTNNTNWKAKLQFPNRVIRLLENNIKPNAFFCIDNKPLILFFENPQNRQKLYKDIWNFNETPVVIIVQDDSVEIFNGFKYEKNFQSLANIGNTDKLTDFTYFKLVTGETWEDYQEHFQYTNRLDYFLLRNIKTARDILKSQVDIKIANALIGKCVFVRYLIDREVALDFENNRKIWKKEDFHEILKDSVRTKKFFDYLKNKFNGNDIFAISDEEYKSVTNNVLDVLVRLLQGDDLKRGMSSFFNFYDFSIIPIEFISNIYESFIGKENQEEKGAYYTPLFLVDYILKETVEKHFKDNKNTDTCITLDPACGSGIFLVETLRKIVENYQSKNQNIEITPEILKNIATKNIYGIDKDPNAIQVAMFSIYLTLLDYQDPADIETFKFPPLLNSNFFEADFFNTDLTLFETKLQSIKFDFIIGNPPWKRGALGEYGETYIKKRKGKEKTEKKKYLATINNGEIAEGFVLRVSDFSSAKTKCALIVRSTILYNCGYNTDYSGFRRYWLEEFFINKIVELALVRKEVFDKSNDKAIAPAAILFYQYANGNNTNDNVLEHITIKPTRFFSYFKIFTINRSDYKKVEQKLLKDNDWLFKTLVYGCSYLDFNLINRLNRNYPTVKKIISDKTRFIQGTGIQYSKNPNYDAKHLNNYPFIDAYAIEPFHINPLKIGTFTKEKVHRIRNEQLFHPPMLLIRKGPDTKSLTLKSAICNQVAVYKDTLTAVKAISNSDSTILQQIEAIFNSNIYSYLAINTFSSIGIEREQIQNYNKFSVPYTECDIVKFAETIEKAKIELHNLQQQVPVDNIKCSKVQKTIDNAITQINETILQALNFNEVERALLDYALNINRPIITRTKKDEYKVLSKLQEPLRNRSKEIIEYASVYLKRFKRNIDTSEQKFVVRIWHTKQLLGMFFEVVPVNTPEENGIIWDEVDNKQILSLLIQLSSEKLTDRLFVQKDIRGFERERFYIFKPNEKRLWHKAIAYLDAEEFMDAILRAGRRGE
jgi:hypothetical protein